MRRIKLHWWILIGIGAGILAGWWTQSFCRDAGIPVEPTAAYAAFDGMSTIFMNLLKMIVIPRVFFSLVSGMQGMGSLARLGRLGLRTFLFYMGTSLLAILTGLTLVNLIRPGVGLQVTVPTEPVE